MIFELRRWIELLNDSSVSRAHLDNPEGPVLTSLLSLEDLSL